MKNFLFKFPSRGRPNQFKSTLLSHINHLSSQNNHKFLFSFDIDDQSMNNEEIREFIKNLKINYEIFYGENTNKVMAINANLKNQEFDVLVLIADDMIPIIKDYDILISESIDNSGHGLDCTVHFYTARWADLLDIWCVMGREYYDRFGYIYHPDYKSICCDNEYTEVSKILNKNVFISKSPFTHEWKHGDETEVRNWWFNSEDSQVYETRKLINFGLNEI